MEIIYCYDGSFDGFLSCIFDSYLYKEIPTAFQCGEDPVSLFDTRLIPTDPSHSARVLRKVDACSKDAGILLRRGFLTCLPDKELYLYRLTVKLLRDGPGFLKTRADDTLYPIAKAVQHLNGEVHLLKGFVRFSEFEGVLAGEIEPKNRVLSLLGPHFCSRFHNETFFLYDRTHQEALFYDGRGPHPVPVLRPLDSFRMAAPDENEARYRILWKRFYDTIAIRERYNPKCRMTQMPKRYWSTMTEFQDEDYFIPRSSPAGVSGPGVPTGIPAPETPPESGPSVPASDP